MTDDDHQTGTVKNKNDDDDHGAPPLQFSGADCQQFLGVYNTRKFQEGGCVYKKNGALRSRRQWSRFG